MEQRVEDLQYEIQKNKNLIKNLEQKNEQLSSMQENNEADNIQLIKQLQEKVKELQKQNQEGQDKLYHETNEKEELQKQYEISAKKEELFQQQKKNLNE